MATYEGVEVGAESPRLELEFGSQRRDRLQTGRRGRAPAPRPEQGGDCTRRDVPVGRIRRRRLRVA